MPFVAPSAKQAFVDMLTASDTMAGVHVQRGLPEVVPTENGRVYVAGVIGGSRRTIADRPYPGNTSGVRLEAFDIRVIVECLVYSGNDADGSAQAEAAMWAIASAIDDLLTDNDELGGAVDASEFMITLESSNPLTNGWIARALGVLHCEKRV